MSSAKIRVIAVDSGAEYYFDIAVPDQNPTCGRCGAIVNDDYLSIHAEWHDQKGL